MNSLFNKNLPPDDVIYSDYHPETSDKSDNNRDIDDMIFSSLPEIKLHSER